MDRVKDSESCSECGHDHYLGAMFVTGSPIRQDDCDGPGCDCKKYVKPEGDTRVYKCGQCKRMVTRIWSSCWGGGYQCESCKML